MRNQGIHFYVQAKDADNMNAIAEIILQYTGIDWDMVNETEMIVYPTEGSDDYALCEMALQMNVHQKKGFVCPCCEDQDVVACGHLTFTHMINPAF